MDGHRVTALVSGWPGAEPTAELDGIQILRTGGRHTFPLAAFKFYRRYLRRQAFDIVIEDLNKVPIYSPLWIPKPLVLLVHHLFGATAFQEAPLPFAAATWLLERPLPIIYRRLPVQAVSQSTALDLTTRGMRSEDIVVIHNGVDIVKFSPDPSESLFEVPTAVYIGRLKRYKRIDFVLRAIAQLGTQGLPVRLIIAGRGDAESALRRTAVRLGIADRVTFTGFVSEDEKVRLLRKAWVHVFTSPKEGWGISNLEAAACGTPTVASDSPGLRDSVVHERTGFLVPHGDSAALADRIRNVLESPALREQLGQGARRFAAEHAWDRSAHRTVAHLESILERGRLPADPLHPPNV